MTHNYYISLGISVEQVRKQAHERARDYRSPEDSIIHFHPYDDNGDNCRNTQHELVEVAAR